MPIDSSTSAPNLQADHTHLNDLQDRLNTGLTGNAINVGGPLLSFNTNTYIFNPDGS